MGETSAIRTQHDIVCGDAASLAGIVDASVDLVVTSPPYPMIEMWDASLGDQSKPVRDALEAKDGWRAFEAMHEVLDRAWAECQRVLRPGGFACVNIGDATRTLGAEFALYPNHARIVQSFRDLGFTPLPEILWRKPTNAPNKFMGSGMLPAGAYVTLEHEFILVLRKGGRRAFASAEEKRRRAEGAFFWEERNKWFSDLWDFKGERQSLEEHERRSAAFPFELPYRLILMFSLPGDTVLDPFAGSGTTLAAALATARNSVGVERDAKLCAHAVERLESIGDVANERARQRVDDHQAFVAGRPTDATPLAHVSATYGFPVMTQQERLIRLWGVASAHREGARRVLATHEPLPATAEAAGARRRQQRLQPWVSSKP